MNATEYSKMALRTAPHDDDERSLLHAAMGMGGEAGEVLDMVKKMEFYKKPIDRQKLLLEISDILWYANLAIKALGSTWEEVFQMNITKLSARYPDGFFDADKAINKDEAAEAKALAKATEHPQDYFARNKLEEAPAYATGGYIMPSEPLLFGENVHSDSLVTVHKSSAVGKSEPKMPYKIFSNPQPSDAAKDELKPHGM